MRCLWCATDVGTARVLVALIALLAEASARVPMVCCRYDAAALAALTALLVEGSLALLATRLPLRQ